MTLRMLGFLFRLLWRVFVGVAALMLAGLTMLVVYPYLEHYLPWFVVIILLYAGIAYAGIPAIVRLWHLVLKPNHLPVYATTFDGWSSDPINIAFVCKRRSQLVKAMRKAGWHEADRATIKTGVRLAYAILFKKPYPNAPFSSLYLLGRRQDLGFQIQTGSPASPRHRHHIRLWELDPTENQHHHMTFWDKTLGLFMRRHNHQVWVGAATHDIAPFAVRAQNLQVTHRIDADTNKERDYVIETLRKSHQVKRLEVVSTGESFSFRGQTFGVEIVVDGFLHVVELKRSW